jgi:SAM-dependent methyltransferase
MTPVPPEDRDALVEENRCSWNAATAAHNSHKADQARFLAEGGSTLFPEELDLLGDLRGRSLLHLLCNSGQDTLSLARAGAAVTGVDVSDVAIACARDLSQESGIPGTFERSEVHAWLDRASRQGRTFDLAFCSYCALCWIPDLDRWARGVRSVLAPGGRLVAVEFHPVAWLFDDQWRLTYPYSTAGQALTWKEGVRDYVGSSGQALAPSGFLPGVAEFANPHPAHEFVWGIGDVLGAILRAGLVLERFEEYPFANGCRMLEEMEERPGRRFVPPPTVPALPLMYGLAASLDRSG